MTEEFYRNLYNELYMLGYHGGSKNFGTKFIKHCVRNLDFANILDIGCSQGSNVKMLVNKYEKDAHGIDVSSIAIYRAKAQLLLGDRVQKGSITNIPHVDSSFDLVFTCDVIEHLKPEDIPVAIKEMIRVTRKYIFIKVAVTEEKNRNWINKLHEKNRYKEIDNLHLSVMSFKEWGDKFMAYKNLIRLYTYNKKHKFMVFKKR